MITVVAFKDFSVRAQVTKFDRSSTLKGHTSSFLEQLEGLERIHCSLVLFPSLASVGGLDQVNLRAVEAR